MNRRAFFTKAVMAPAVLLTPWEPVLPGESKIGSITAHIVIDERKVADIILRDLQNQVRNCKPGRA